MGSPLNRQEAQESADRIRAFRRQLEELERERVLTLSAEQRESLDAYLEQRLESLAATFDIDTTESQKQISWGMRIASALGGVALCAAVVLFFYRFWGLLTTPVQVAVLIAAPLLALGATEFAARRERTLYYAALAAMVAFASFVLNLTVLGAVFNVTPTQNALLAWGAFGLALAYAYELRLLLIAGLASVLGYLAATTASWHGFNWLTFGQRPENFIPGGLVVFLLPLWLEHRRHADFPAVYRLTGSLVYFLAVLWLASEGTSSYLPFDNKNIEHLYEATGFLSATGAIWLGIRRGWRGVVNTGSTFFAVFLFLRLIRWWWDLMPKYLFFFLVGAVAIVLVACFKRLRSRLQEAPAA